MEGKIEEALGVTASIERWEENFDITHGCVKPPQSFIGCPKLLTADMIENIQETLHEDPTLLDEIKEWVTLYHDQPILTLALLSHINGLWTQLYNYTQHYLYDVSLSHETEKKFMPIQVRQVWIKQTTS